MQNSLEFPAAQNLLESFSFSIKGEIVLRKKDKKSTCAETYTCLDTEAIFNRIMCFIGLNQVNLETALNYRLAPIPPTLFQGNGEIWNPKAKSVLKTILEVTVLGRAWRAPNAVVIDGSAIFYTADWQNRRTITELSESMSKYIEENLMLQDICIVFDRYRGYRIASSTWEITVQNLANYHYFS